VAPKPIVVAAAGRVGMSTLRNGRDHARRRSAVLGLRLRGQRHMSQALFRAAEAEVSIVIQQAAASAAGDPWRALERVREWADAVPGRRTLLIQAQRYRIAPLAVLDEVINHAFEVVGDDEDAILGLVSKYLQSPEVRDRLERELGELAGAALVEWVDEACEMWRDERLA
jgi:hypothetical protein